MDDVARREVLETLRRLREQAEALAREVAALERRLTGDVPGSSPSPAPPGLAAWLRSRGIDLREAAEPGAGEAEAELDRLAELIGRWHDETPPLQQLLTGLRRGGGRAVVLDLSEAAPEVISRVTNVAHRLHRLAVLARYVYVPGKRRLTAVPAAGGPALTFLLGGWFERYVYLEVAAALRARGGSWEALRNVRVVLPSGQEAEFDLLVLPGGWTRPIWVEARAGEYQEDLPRYRRLARELGLPPEGVLVAVLGLSWEEGAVLSRLHEVTVVPGGGVRAAVASLLEGRSPSLPGPDATAIRRLLGRRRMRPLPEVRPAVLAAVAEALRASPALDRRELVQRAAEATGASRRAAGELVRALRRGGALPDGEEAVLEEAALEEACVRAYLAEVEAAWPGAVRDPEVWRAFREAVQPRLPEPRLEALREEVGLRPT